MKHLALFNGIGGFQLAACWMGWQNVAHVEIDPFCNKIVAKHFPMSKCHTDIKQFNGKEYEGTIDIISGGEPCQPHSIAGFRKGQNDNRYLWPEMFRVIREVQPAWVVNENVVGTISNGILDLKIDDLENEGYTCQAFIIPASAVGALHRRERVWLIAYDPDKATKLGIAGNKNKKSKKKRISCRKIQYTQEPVNLWFDNSYPNTERQQECNNAEKSVILSEGVSRYFGFGNAPYGNFTENQIKSAIIRSLNGLPEGLDYPWRNKRIAALGNAIVPQVAYEIFKIIDKI